MLHFFVGNQQISPTICFISSFLLISVWGKKKANQNPAKHISSNSNKKVLSSSVQFYHPVLIFDFITTHYSPFGRGILPTYSSHKKTLYIHFYWITCNWLCPFLKSCSFSSSLLLFSIFHQQQIALVPGLYYIFQIANKYTK